MRIVSYTKEAYTELVQKSVLALNEPAFSLCGNRYGCFPLLALVVLVMDLAFENIMKTIYNILY